MQKPQYHVFVCTSSRINGQQKGYCFSKEGVDIVQRFMEEVDERALQDTVMITNTGCFGICSSGPIVVVYPEGVWYKEVTPDDVAEIVESHFENGQKVERLEIK
ncbi:(2Fe-2S) ferredoxin [Anaerobacterium chartisolvens]|uniref:(2Fe-2S) ferredoxin n=1 Tax=Anaerobacterium chartisolvens TaxID=1297424 RepID=A0A369ATM4_9FIRM|nr:2Fe-2S ferredoxin [Anaerobacterium chartisolvens]RCX12722.1 (2Fe-2S) ferredoxin [Anaerobacterium chartisolvens]